MNIQDLIKDNVISDEERGLIERLLQNDQAHLFEGWDSVGVNDKKKHAFLSELLKVDRSYPGGLEKYITNARTLLANAQFGVNPYDGFIPEQPDVIDLSELGMKYSEYESLATDNMEKIGIVLVAGGLGERLGYNGIKLDIPIELINNTSYLEHYALVIRAMEQRMSEPHLVPLVVMTSQDTKDKTIKTLESNNYFGLKREQVHILMQELVPAISDNDGHLALSEKYSLIMKPHGHGDIHMLLYSSGTARKLMEQGITHLLFIQDTNGQVFNAGLAAVGASMKENFDFNSVAVNRIPGEAVGALAKLKKEDAEMTINIEYNQLDPLLRATVSSDGDVPNEKGFSIFPGNINVLVVKVDTYVKILDKSQGIIAEFVNPKYEDAQRKVFKKPTRLETMMQDLPKLFDINQKVGVTIFQREWCFSADKNNIIDAKLKYENNGPPESAATAESDFYLAGRMKCRFAGMSVSEMEKELVRGIPLIRGPRVILYPSFALTLEEVRNKIHGGSISGESTLVLNGEGITVENLSLSGKSALVINAVKGAKVVVKNVAISNDGFELIKLTDEEMESDNVPEYLKIRGYRLEDSGARICNFDQPGEYVVEE